MKKRSGFVSNSSSSSFCMYGVDVDEDWFTDEIKQKFPDAFYDGYEDDGLGEVIHNVLKGSKLRYSGNSDVGYTIGKHWSNVGDDETGGSRFARHTGHENSRVIRWYGTTDCIGPRHCTGSRVDAV